MTISLVISIISLSLCVSGFFFLRWYISQRTAASRLLEGYRDEVYRLISEIDAATDRDSLLVEERIKTLRKLLDDTEKRISVYTRERQRSRNSEAIYKNLGRGIREALDSSPVAASSAKPEGPAAPETTSPAEIIELPFTDEEKGPKVGSVKKQRKRKTANKQTPRPEKPGKKMQIAQMALQGLSPSEIAVRLGISLAEVDLALKLLNLPGKE
jgi:DNA-directed RNA polymerase specialized sigma24 family protein